MRFWTTANDPPESTFAERPPACLQAMAMSEVRTLIVDLVERGIDPVDAAEIVTRAAIHGAASVRQQTAGAIRQERYRHNKASQVTESDAPSLSPSPTPLTLNPTPKENPPKGGQKKGSEEFEAFRAVYPKRLGSNPWEPARVKFDRAVKAGADPGAIVAGAGRYAAEQASLGKVGTEFVMQAKAWLNQKCWQDYPEPAEFRGEIASDGKVYVSQIDPEWPWCVARFRQEKGHGPPRDAQGGWRFPEDWTKGQEREEAA